VTGRAGCLSCHRAHNAASLGKKGGLLAAAPSALDTLCRACHESHFDGSDSWNHPVGGAVGERSGAKLAKLAGYGGIMGKENTVLCLSCHKAHGSLKGTRGLVVNRQALCLYCHSEQNSLAPRTASFGTHPISVKPVKASVSTAFLEAGGTMGAGGEVICLTCHRTHGGALEGGGLVLPRQDYSCTLCHTAMQEMASTAHGRAGLAGTGGGDRDTCGSCHSSHGWNIPLEEAGMGGSVIERVCWHCHGPEGSVPMPGYFGHILGVTPSGGTGGRDLPLFWNDGRRLERGLLTCSTCHDVHRDPVEYSLRLKPGEKRSELCLGCHHKQEAVKGTKHDLALYFPGEKNRLDETASSTGVCGACHLAHSSGLGDSWAREIEPSPGEPGRLMSFCAVCHSDGSFAQGKVVSERTHPVPDVLSENPEMGAVDCDGCHDTHVWNPFNPSDKGDFFTPGDNSTSFLVSPASGRSPLCLKCHSAEVPVAGTKHDMAAKGDGEGLCEVCHLAHGGQELLMWPYPLEKEESYGSEICLHCHDRGEEGADHPLAVSPGSRSGEELPLYLPSGRKYFRGKISCGTCHNPHVWSSSPGGGGRGTAEGGRATSFLRMEADGYSPLCFPCHAERSMVVGTDHDLRVTAPDAVNHNGLTADESGVCGSCHGVHGARHMPFLWNRETGPGEDPQSRYCRSCHGEEGIEEAATPPRSEAHLVSYPGKGLVSRPVTRKQISLLGSASSLSLYSAEGEEKTRGYISCATCHDAHRWEPDTSRSGMGVPLDGDSQNSFLKERSTFSIGGSLCKQCHGEDSLEMYQQYHFPEGKPPEPWDPGAGN
jgi:predicted CXXCH cytochrome family protein